MKRLIFILGMGLLTFLNGCLDIADPEQYFLAEIYYPELSNRVYGLDSTYMDENWLYLVDFGNREDYNAGHILHAENLEIQYLMDERGVLVNKGKALTERYDKRWPLVVYSSSNDTMAYYIARTARGLGYTKVYFYEGGVEDWQKVHGDFLVIGYDWFKSWLSAYYPFEDTLQALVDIHPANWYYGSEELDGHIPGAINIPVSSFVEERSESIYLINEGAVLSDTIADRNTRIVIYNAIRDYDNALLFLKGAQDLDYKNLFLFPNGYEEWIKAGDTLSVHD